MAKLVDVTDRTFEAEVLRSQTPVLTEFWAEWCAPCKMIAPVLEEIAAEYDGRLKIAKVDVDTNNTERQPVWRPQHPHLHPLQGWSAGGPAGGRGA